MLSSILENGLCNYNLPVNITDYYMKKVTLDDSTLIHSQIAFTEM